MPAPSERLLRGAIDIHAHAYPEYTLALRPRQDNYDWALLAKEYGMRGIMLKSHVWPTMAQVYDLSKLVEGIELYSSITLNYTAGGLSPVAVALAGEMGAKAVFMPTWSAKNDIERSGVMAARIRKVCPLLDDLLKANGGGITVLDHRGKVKPEVLDILDIIKTYDMYLESGHLHISEGLRLAEACAVKGVRFSLTHPHNTTVGATAEQQKEVADMGGYIEHTYIACMPLHLRVNPRDIAKSIRLAGVAKTIFTTDSINAFNPPEPELMRMVIETLLHLEFSEAEISKMVRENPAEILRLPPDPGM
ncbi:MAG: DUF6282 family protein [Peptococcaceae bacterium]|jgi:hypothetical protein|nr:DUF6282 family protein [Peptococcaceae bacterium]